MKPELKKRCIIKTEDGVRLVFDALPSETISRWGEAIMSGARNREFWIFLTRVLNIEVSSDVFYELRGYRDLHVVYADVEVFPNMTIVHVLFDKTELQESVKISDDARVPPKNWTDLCKGMYVEVDSNRQCESQLIHMNHFVNGCSGRHPYGKEETNMNTNNTNHELPDSVKQHLHVLRCKAALSDLGIRKVIFNNNATIVFWVNGTKTVVKCCEMDTYSREAAIAIAIMKHKVGENNYHYVMDTLLGKKGDHFTHDTVSRIPTSIDIIDMNKEDK